MKMGGISGTLLALAAATLAAQVPDSRWQFSGFGTLGVAATSTHQVAYLRDVTQPKGIVDHPEATADSRLGLQWGGRFSENLYGSVQVLSKYRYDGTFRPVVHSAFLGWNPTTNLELRAGRLNIEFNLAGDSRDVGYSYLFVRPPVEFYARNAPNQFTGMDVASTFPLAGGHTLRVKAWGGTIAEERIALKNADPWSVTGNPVGGLIVDWQGGPWRAKASWEVSRFIVPWAATIQVLPDTLEVLAGAVHEPKLLAAATALQIKGGVTHSWNAALAYESGPVQAQMELSRLGSNRLALPNAWGGYASFGYRMGAVVPYGLFSRVVSPQASAPDLGILPTVPDLGPRVVAAVQDLLYYLHNNQTTVAAGLRWDFRPKTALKLQVDHIRANDAPGLWFRLQPGWDGKAKVYSVTLDFVFGGGR